MLIIIHETHWRQSIPRSLFSAGHCEVFFVHEPDSGRETTRRVRVEGTSSSKACRRIAICEVHSRWNTVSMEGPSSSNTRRTVIPSRPEGQADTRIDRYIAAQVKLRETFCAAEVLISEIVKWVFDSTISSKDAREWREVTEVHGSVLYAAPGFWMVFCWRESLHEVPYSVGSVLRGETFELKSMGIALSVSSGSDILPQRMGRHLGAISSC